MIYECQFTIHGRHRVTGIAQIANDISENGHWVNAVNERGETPLHIAAQHKQFDLFEVMLPHFDNITARDKEGNTVIHSLLDKSMVHPSKYDEKCSELIRTLMYKAGNVNDRNRNGWTPVHLAARNCQLQVLEVLEEHQPNFNLRTKFGETALHVACKNMTDLVDTPKKIKIINNLIGNGCDVNAKNDRGYSALHYAVDYCGVKVVERLIECGADLNCQTENLELTPLHLATRNKNLVVMEVLIKAGANVDPAAYSGLTPLSLAVIIGSLEIAKYFLDNHSNFDYIHYWTPLHLAIYLRRKRLFNLLIDKQLDVNVPGVEGLTPLHLASMLGSFKFAKALIDRGANVNSRDMNQYTSLHTALKTYYFPNAHHLMQSSFHEYQRDSSLSEYFAPFFNTSTIFLIRNFVIYFGGKKKISRILIEAGAEVNAVTKDNESPLYFAAKKGDVQLVRSLLKLGADIDCQEKEDGYTPLHAASFHGRVDVVKELVKANANLEIISNKGQNPLHLAAYYDRARAVKELIKANADVNATTRDGKSALHLATMCDYGDVIKELLISNPDVNIRDENGKKPFDIAMERNKSKGLELLIKHEPLGSEEDRRLRNSALHIAARENDLFMIKHYLAFGAKINAENYLGFTPLHFAVSHGHVEATRALIDSKADVNCKTKRSQLTPLHMAIEYYSRRKFIVEMLIKADANVKAADVRGVTPLHLAILHDVNEYSTTLRGTIIEALICRGADVNCTDKELQFTALHVAIHTRDWDMFELLMERSDVNVNVSDKNGLTPLHLASLVGSVKFAKVLLLNGAYINRRDANDYTPLHYAIRNREVLKDSSMRMYSNYDNWTSKPSLRLHSCASQKYNEVMKLLIDHGADLKAVVRKNKSLFYFAAEANAFEFVKILIDTELAVNFEESHFELTALQTAASNDYKETVELLVSSGADVNIVTESGKSMLHLAAESGGASVLKYLLRRPESNSKIEVKRCPFMYRIDEDFEPYVEFNVNTKDSSGRTPLHSAVMSSNHKQATETLLAHGAFMDVQDNNGYMPIHYAIKYDRDQPLESLLAFGVDINDYKVYNKLDLQKIKYAFGVGQLLVQHIMKLKALEFPIASVYELILQERDYLSDVFYNKCLREIENMKVYFVERGVSLYDMLHVNRRGRRVCINNLELQVIEKEFPIYYNLILDFYHENIVKKSMMKKAELALIQLTNVNLPLICTDKILYYLGVVSVVTLIKAAGISPKNS